MRDFKPFSSLLVTLVVANLACAPDTETPSERVPEVIPVGYYGALTGPTASFGVSSRNGALLAVEQINAAGGVLGRRVRLFEEDTQGKPEEAAAVVTKLITARGVVALIGENASSRSLAAAPIAQSAGVPMLSPSSTNPEVTRKGDFIFRLCYTDSDQGDALARFVANELMKKKAAILQDVKNDYSVGLAEVFTKSFTERGGTIVANQSYSEGDTDFRSQLTAIRASAPEVIFVPGYYTDAGVIAIQARELGIRSLLVGGDGWESPKLIEIGGSAIEGSYYAAHYAADEPREAVQNFVRMYRERFGVDPDGPAALAYDAMRVLAEAIRSAGSLDRKAIRDRIASTREFPGVTGVIAMGPDRNPVKPVAMLSVTGGKAVFNRWIAPESSGVVADK